MKMLIAGEWVDAADGATLRVENPCDQSLLGTVPSATVADGERAVAAAQEAKRAMAAQPAHRRAAVLSAVADRIEQNRDALVRSLCLENGRTFREINHWDLDVTVRIFRAYAEEAKRLFGQSLPLSGVPGQENSLAFTVYQPVGVVAAIIPFNYPLELWAHKVAAALAAGNAVISKPPEECPLTLLTLAGYLEDAGLPRGAHQMLTGKGEVIGAFLAETPGVDLVAMTGSSAVGRAVTRAAATTLKRVQLELSGNDATIIMDDVAPKRAAAALIAGRFTAGNGQLCCAVKRALIHEGIFDAVKEQVLSRTARLKVGDQSLPDTDVGPLINEAAARRVEAQLKRAVEEGAVLECGGRRRGAFITPAVLTGVTQASVPFQEEIFGPVLPLVPFRTLDEAIALANASAFGLQAAIFTDQQQVALQAAMKLEVATVLVNSSTALRVELLPFGGRKGSGNSREGVLHTLREMSELKTVILKDAYRLYDT